MITLRPEHPSDQPIVETLLDRTFGNGRFGKVSYRYREGVSAIQALCYVAEIEHEIVGCIRYWPILLDKLPCLLLGPLGIDPRHKNIGIGRSLVTHSLGAAAIRGEQHVFLVGDHAYYRRYGFEIAPPAVIMPDERPERLNWLGLNGAAPPEAGGTLRSWRCLRSGSSNDSVLVTPNDVAAQTGVSAWVL